MQTLQEKIVSLFPHFIKKLVFPNWIEAREFLKSIVIEIPPESLFLDAGAGQCQYKDIFHKQKYFAIDAAIGDINWNYSELDAVSDLSRMPFRKETFKTVICTQVLEHVKEPQAIINEMFRILQPGGFLYLSAPQGWGVHQEPYDFFRFTCYGLQYLFEKAGFQIIYIKPSSGYFGYLANRLSILPKYLFWQIKNPLIRILFLPFELLSFFFFVFFFPAILNSMDFLDKKREYTLNYFVKASKPEFRKVDTRKKNK
ncbi:MAG: class I SAM-dependent methyltransferase [Spirochaetes bacterium]|jgi:SAM-dependent methyltransferase|nr:class I SAM-dependent methyltransferase [Spirochaetota bacterium]